MVVSVIVVEVERVAEADMMQLVQVVVDAALGLAVGKGPRSVVVDMWENRHHGGQLVRVPAL